MEHTLDVTFPPAARQNLYTDSVFMKLWNRGCVPPGTLLICPENLGIIGVYCSLMKTPNTGHPSRELVCSSQQWWDNSEGAFQFWDPEEPLVHVWWTTCEKTVSILIFFKKIKHTLLIFSLSIDAMATAGPVSILGDLLGRRSKDFQFL